MTCYKEGQVTQSGAQQDWLKEAEDAYLKHVFRFLYYYKSVMFYMDQSTYVTVFDAKRSGYIFAGPSAK